MNQEHGASALTLLVIRGFDLVFSLAALLALSPLLVLVAIACASPAKARCSAARFGSARGTRVQPAQVCHHDEEQPLHGFG